MADLERDRGADGAGDARGGLGLSGRRWYLGGGAIATMVDVGVLQPRSLIVNSSSGQLTRHPAFHHSPLDSDSTPSLTRTCVHGAEVGRLQVLKERRRRRPLWCARSFVQIGVQWEDGRFAAMVNKFGVSETRNPRA